ncbi:MAG: 50S ribosomal protein L6 [Patescibacteria group bacterium]
MSRIGKKPITIPTGVAVSVLNGTVTVKGKAGTLVRNFRPIVSIVAEGNEVIVSPHAKTRLAKALWGTYAAHVKNMIAGVEKPFAKQLIIEGVGYKANIVGKKVVLAVGYSHPVELEIPDGVTVTVEKGVVTISGIDRDIVGQFAANIRATRKPEPYKGKGIRYSDEVIRRKQGKKTVG